MSRTDMKLTEMHFLVHFELLVRHGARKKNWLQEVLGDIHEKQGPLPGEIVYRGHKEAAP